MLRCILICSFMLLFVQVAHQQANTAKEAPLIETTLGRIRGSVLTSRKGRDFYAYRGIYYGKAPIGQRRFAAPEPVEPWNGTLDALADGPTCPQIIPNIGIYEEVERDENCLTVNVFTANVTASNPVIFYIHGGANIYGNPHSESKARPHYLLDEDVVVVGVYFRVGPLGFLTTGTPDAPGNFAYLDHVLALKWIKHHIANFGGDPNRVTLMGYSTGSSAVTAHLVSPLSAGLFHGIIPLSGSVTGHADIDNVYWSRKLAHELGCPKYDAQLMLNCLRKFSWQEMVNACARWEVYQTIERRWNFEIDGNFILEDPTEAVRHNRFNRVPIMAGLTRNEAEIEYETEPISNHIDLLNDINLNLGLYVADFLDFKSNGNDDERVKILRQFYFNTASIDQNNIRTFSKLKSDCEIGHNVYRLVELAKHYTNVYYYRFDYNSTTSVAPDLISHGDDVSLIIPNIDQVLDDNAPDHFMVDRMTKLVVSFAANGAPPVIENVTWPRFTDDNPVVFYMDTQPYTGGRYYMERFTLWDELFPLKESSADIQFPAIVLVFFAAGWHQLL